VQELAIDVGDDPVSSAFDGVEELAENTTERRSGRCL
jgi:hypothetical protein